MKIIPAVDIKEGRCVRLSQGKADQETVYSDDPVAMACHWDEEGAPLIHVVDLDGAFDGQPANAEIVKKIIYNSSVDIQVGGGIRNLKTIETYVNAGAFRVILGTIAQKEPEFVAEACKKFPGKIIVGIDADAVGVDHDPGAGHLVHHGTVGHAKGAGLRVDPDLLW